MRVDLRSTGWDRVAFTTKLPAQIALRGLAEEMAWTPESRDLVEVAIAVTLADRVVRRSGESGRRIRLDIPVRRPELWTDSSEALSRALRALTHDAYAFGFRAATRGEVLLPWDGQPGVEVQADRVALFSGGLDSACAAAHFAKTGATPVYVTQYTNGIARANALLTDIASCYGTQPVVHAAFWTRPIVRRMPPLQDDQRRTRPFLFLSLALATAVGTNSLRVSVCENGPLALNLPLAAAMVPTRHAHGRFLRAMAEFATELFGQRIQIENPFELSTKGEMTKIFHDHPQLALRSTSCWRQQWSGRGATHGRGHCGYCLPCLVRLTALHEAGIRWPDDHFDVDIRRLESSPRGASDDHLTLTRDLLLRLADRAASCASWREFLSRFPYAVESCPTSPCESEDAWFDALHQMMLRFSSEVKGALSA